MNLKAVSLTVSCALVFALSLMFERHAYAYVDPGSSLFLLQSLSAMFTGCLFYFRKRLKALIGRSKAKEAGSGEDVA